MLVLSRDEGEEVVMELPSLPGPIEISVIVLEIGRGKFRLGFETPEFVQISRVEAEHLIGLTPPPPAGGIQP